MIEVIFLISLALIWILFSVIADFKHRIVPNWLNFSLIIFALAFRFFYSLFANDFAFFYHGIIGLGIFFAIGNSLYYGRMFAGGDAKLMIALGAILPFSNDLTANAEIFATFFLLFLLSGAIYGFGWMAYLSAKNFNAQKREFRMQFGKNKKTFILSIAFAILFLIAGFYNSLFFYLGLIVFLIPYLYSYAKAVDETSLVKNVKTKNLSEGDWLYHDLKIGKKLIKAKWDGLSKEEIRLIRKKFREVKIRHGIPFTPSFLISFAILIWFYFKGINFTGLI